MAGALTGKVALVAGATRGAGRGTAVALGEAGATVYCTGRTTRDRRSEYDRPETIEETAELVDAAGGEGIAVEVDHLEPAQVEALVAPHRLRAGPAGRARERHLGWREARRVEHPGVGARPGRRPADAAPGDRHAPDHQPLRAGAADPPPGRAGGGDDRRHAGVQRRALPAVGVLRPGEDRGHPAGVRAGQRAGAARLHRRRVDARLDAVGDDARALRGDRGELARGGAGATRISPRSPSRRASSGARWPPWPPTPTCTAATAGRSPPAAWRASMASPTSTAPSRTAGATWWRSRTPGTRPTRPATAEVDSSAMG